jgi:simple sugar transport system permease protein/ribose transport system permease protein
METGIVKMRGRLIGRIANCLLDNVVWVMFLFSLFILGMLEPGMFSPKILINIVRQASVLGVLTAGVAFTLLIGEIDLSATGNMAVSAFIGIMGMKAGIPWYISVLIILGSGTLIGMFNGLVITKLGAIPLMETLALNMVLQGILVFGTHGVTVTNLAEGYKMVGQGKIFGIDLLPIIFLSIYAVVAFCWRRTVLGRGLFAVGGNSYCALVSGVKVDRIKIYAYMICGFLAGVAGFMLSGYMGAITPSFGREYQMTSVASAVIGGVSISGGRGKAICILGGVFLLTVVKVGLQVAGLDAYYVSFTEGLMVFIAVVIDSIRIKYQVKR